MSRRFCVYILASRPRGAPYIGVTNDLDRRLWEHRTGLSSNHVRRYGIHRLVWMEEFDTPDDAIYAEKRLKVWKRAWKIELIESVNPQWEDLIPS